MVKVDDDAQLLARLRAGEEAAFAELIAAYQVPLRRLALTFVRTPSVADDVVQETWMGVLRGLDSFEGRSSLKTWIFTILANRARTRAVKEARSIPFSSLGPEENGPAVDPSAFGETGLWVHGPGTIPTDPQERLLARELRERLTEVVDTLPPNQRAVITLRDMVGLSSEEVADLLEVSEGNQRVLLHRARSRVRRELGAYVEEPA